MIQFRNLKMMVLLTVLLWSPSIGQEVQGDPGDYKSGEKVFRELVNADGESCLDCHYFDETDTINWNPSVMALSGRVEIYKAKGLGEYFNAPAGVLMKKVHDGVSLTGDQEEKLIAYLDHLQHNPYIQSAPFRWKRLLFLGMFLFLILMRIEKVRLKQIPKVARRVLVLAAWGMIGVFIVQAALGFNLSKDYAPIQPVKFSHAIHATDNKIDCNYCHPGVLKGRNAGVPPVSLCMNCHRHQPEGTRTGKFEIRKVLQAAEDSVAIRWVRIHALPDFTYFNHMQHVTIGGIECLTCHGDVENMHVLSQVEDLSMGWCIKCHDETKVDFSNDYYKNYYPVLADSLVTGKLDSIMVSDINGRECSVCHY
ncbi:MAG: cytochrome c3 family protein [Bacteroidetes bacterium]|nr:cytochrome c3 family protein [Bacteroidota bacterium]